MTKRLRRYLEARERGGWGWKDRYEKDVLPGGESWPWLAGHYCGMLSDLAAALGDRRIRALLDEDDSAPREG